MATIQSWYVLLWLICCWNCHTCSSVLEPEPDLRKQVVELAESQVGIRELTGNNDGKEIEEYLNSTGLPEGNPWCAAFLSWLFTKLGIPNPQSAWSPDWFKDNVVFSKFKTSIENFQAKIAQVFGLWFDNKNRVAHVGLIVNVLPNHFETVEGNTSLIGAILDFMNLSPEDKENERDGIWVAKKTRNKRDIAMISDFIND